MHLITNVLPAIKNAACVTFSLTFAPNVPKVFTYKTIHAYKLVTNQIDIFYVKKITAPVKNVIGLAINASALQIVSVCNV